MVRQQLFMVFRFTWVRSAWQEFTLYPAEVRMLRFSDVVHTLSITVKF